MNEGEFILPSNVKPGFAKRDVKLRIGLFFIAYDRECPIRSYTLCNILGA